jgi:orotate phosphoribosyltransferase
MLQQKYGIKMRLAYDRKEAKTHGEATAAADTVVGDLKEGDRVLLIDDVITTGATKVEALEKLNALNKGLKVGGLLILFDREEVDTQGRNPLAVFEEQGIKTFTVLKARELFDYLRNKEINGRVLVTDEIYALFQQHQKEFGRKIAYRGSASESVASDPAFADA